MLTDFNDFTIALDEHAFATVIKAFRRQAPMLFNYATVDLIASIHQAVADKDEETLKHLLCDVAPIDHNANRKQPLPVAALFTPAPYLPIPGYEGNRGISYVLQVGDIKFDFHPNNTISLPNELTGEFKEQMIGLQLTLCAGIACPDRKKLDELLDEIPPPAPFDPNTFGDRFQKIKLPTAPTDFPKEPFDTEGVDCFCLTVIALAHIRRRPLVDPGALEYLSIELTALEIVDVTPPGLESTLECLIYLTLNFGLLPKLRLLLKDLAVAHGPFGIRMAPVSSKIPFNPSVAKDELQAFLNITVS